MADAKLSALSTAANVNTSTRVYGIDSDTGTSIVSEKITATQLHDFVRNPITNDGQALGTTALKWADLWLADGGKLDFNSGDVTVTHNTNSLDFVGGTLYNFNVGQDNPIQITSAGSGYAELNFKSGLRFIAGATGDATMYIDVPSGGEIHYRINSVDKLSVATGDIHPGTNDGMSMGTSSNSWSDLFLADSGVINFGNGTATLTCVGARIKASTGQLAHFWVYWTGNSTTILASHNVTSIDDDTTGDAGINLTTAFSSNNFAAFVCTNETGTDGWDSDSIQSCGINVHTSATVDVLCGVMIDGTTAVGNTTEPDQYQAVGFGVSA